MYLLHGTLQNENIRCVYMSTIPTGHSNFRDKPAAVDEEVTADGSEFVPFQNAAVTKSGKLCQFALFVLR